MPIVTSSSSARGVPLKYVTIGAILAVLSGTSYFYLPGSADHQILGYIRMCALILGVVLLVIGFGAGRTGQVAVTTQPVVGEPIAPPVVAPVAAPALHAANDPAVLTTANVSHANGAHSD